MSSASDLGPVSSPCKQGGARLHAASLVASGSFAAALCGIGAILFASAAGAQTANVNPSPAAPFSTKLGTFTPQPWSAISGWPQDSHAEALRVFQQTCGSLRRRETWKATCGKAQAVGTDAAGARTFFESEFVPYLVEASEPGKEGLMTGYFEPVLHGSIARRPPFVVPVYGAPSDLLFLDARRWQGLPRDGSVPVTVADNQVLPVRSGAQSATGLGSAAVAGPALAAAGLGGGLELDPNVFDSEPLDRRYRVRRDGKRIVSYWTRQEIDAGAAIGATVIAWVDDPQALYLMQVQGSGQIRLQDGKLIRLSYADQNGHPFRPRGRIASATRTRGLPGADGSEPVAVATPVSMGTLSLVTVLPQKSPGKDKGKGKGKDAGKNGVGKGIGSGAAVAAAANEGEVERIIDSLLATTQRKASGSSAPPPSSPSSPIPFPAAPEQERSDARVAQDLGYLVAAREKDPSYVFFQPAPAGGSGPVGALGVPLTATRSIAVDPRSTPLGAPVFIKAEREESAEPLRRLMIAQDTGGAIRGAVRADFFWGTGPKAGAQAVRTRDDLAMWVLLPKDFRQPAGSGTRSRSIGGGPAASECVIPDSEYCLE